MKKKSLIVFAVFGLIIAVVASYFVSGQNFLGMVRAPQDSRQDMRSFKTGEKMLVTRDEINITETDQLTRTIADRSYVNADVKTSWYPSQYREESNKNLIKLFPFPTASMAGDIYGVIREKFNKWRHIGLKGGGVIASIDYSEQDHEHLLMGTYGSGLYRTDDFGENWTKLNSFPSNRVFEATIDPNDDSHYMAFADIIYLYESFDYGATWSLNKTVDASSFYPVELEWMGNTIFARVSNNVYISFDNGQSWTNHTLPFMNGYVKIKDNGRGAAIGATSNNGLVNLYTTQDYGQTWQYQLSSYENGEISAFDISDDGERIVVAFFNESDKAVFFKEKDGLNASWISTYPNLNINVNYPQDLLLDPNDPDHFVLFVYCAYNAFFETNDRGQTLASGFDTIDEFDSVVMKYASSNDAAVISPLDLKFNNMRQMIIEIPASEIILNTQLQNSILQVEPNLKVVESATKEFVMQDVEFSKVEPPTITNHLYLLPTDQGLYYYDTNTRRMTNMVKDLYLGETGRVAVTSCPKIYAGLWHIGHFFIDQNGLIKGYRSSEKSGVTLGEDLGCNTPVMYSQGMYSADGETIDMDVTQWILNTFQLSSIGTNLFNYHDGWWYGIVQNKLVRFDVDTRQIEYLYDDQSKFIFSYTIEDGSSRNPTYWMLSRDDSDFSVGFWYSNDLVSWNFFKDASVLAQPTVSQHVTINGNDYYYDGALLYSGSVNIYKNGNQMIVAGGVGMAVSNDSGDNWEIHFPYGRTTNIVRDNKGRLFIGLAFSNNLANHVSGQNVNGLWYSVDNGETWDLLEPELDKSMISGLAIDNNRNILYASTDGETLIQLQLNDYNLPSAKVMLKKSVEGELVERLN